MNLVKVGTKVPINITLYFSKALHHANCAGFYFDLILAELKPQGKIQQFLKKQSNNCKAVKNDVLTSMRQGEGKEIMKDDLQDPLMLDALCDSFLMLDDNRRAQIEFFIGNLVNQQLKEDAANNTPNQINEQLKQESKSCQK